MRQYKELIIKIKMNRNN